MANVSLVFINHHFSSSSIRPLTANMIEIGGIHVDKVKPLPKDIQEFLDSADEGVILFTMGSILNGINWPVEKREAFVRAFGKLKQKVLWKYENDTLPNNPGNIMIKSWIPQRDVLAHPNVKLFITHGGLLGATEAMVEGVPILGIPIYADQKMNVLTAENKGFGMLMEYEEISQKIIEENLKKILMNSEYYENAKLHSNRFNDRIKTPEETTVYWVEYVIRHQGAPHLTSPAHNLNYAQRNLIDVYGFLTLISLLIVTVNLWIFRMFLKRITTKASSNRKYKEN
jgi:glucuronosyltransferase